MKVLIDISDKDIDIIKNAAEAEGRTKKNYIERLISRHAKTISPQSEGNTKEKPRLNRKLIK